jgi:hypothetical protein
MEGQDLPEGQDSPARTAHEAAAVTPHALDPPRCGHLRRQAGGRIRTDDLPLTRRLWSASLRWEIPCTEPSFSE